MSCYCLGRDGQGIEFERVGFVDGDGGVARARTKGVNWKRKETVGRGSGE